MTSSSSVEPPIKTVDPRSRARKMIGLAAVGANLQIVVRGGLAAKLQVLGDLRPHIVVEVSPREQLNAIPTPPIQPEPRDAGEVAHRRSHASIPLAKGKPVLQLKCTKPLWIV